MGPVFWSADGEVAAGQVVDKNRVSNVSGSPGPVHRYDVDPILDTVGVLPQMERNADNKLRADSVQKLP